jgi:hypothetical protein
MDLEQKDKNWFQAYGDQRQAEIAILVSGEAEFKTKLFRGDKEINSYP